VKNHPYLAEGLRLGPDEMDEDEFIELHWLPMDELLRRMERGEIKGGKAFAGACAEGVRALSPGSVSEIVFIWLIGCDQGRAKWRGEIEDGKTLAGVWLAARKLGA
jgi:hypothetical protein